MSHLLKYHFFWNVCQMWKEILCIRLLLLRTYWLTNKPHFFPGRENKEEKEHCAGNSSCGSQFFSGPGWPQDPGGKVSHIIARAGFTRVLVLANVIHKHICISKRNSLSDVTACLRERLHRWQQIERICGFPIIRNAGLATLTAQLYSDSRVPKPPCSRHSSVHGSIEDLLEDASSQILSQMSGQWQEWWVKMLSVWFLGPTQESLLHESKVKYAV